MRRFCGAEGGVLPPDVPVWLTVTAWPAMVTVPVRAAPELAAMLNVTFPIPAPVAPLVTVIQSTVLVALHVH